MDKAITTTRTNKCYNGCLKCSMAVNTINGRFCTHLKRYVQYTVSPPCGIDVEMPIADRIKSILARNAS